MHDLRQHYFDLELELRPMGRFFGDSEEGSVDRGYFEEFLDANEFELALHTLCDFLIDCSCDAIDENAINRIGTLHAKMLLEDDCVPKLKRHCLST